MNRFVNGAYVKICSVHSTALIFGLFEFKIPIGADGVFQERINISTEDNDLYLDALNLALSTVHVIKYDVKNLLEGINDSDPLNSVIGVDEASELWNLSAGYIKNLCAEGKIKAKKIGKTWIIDVNHPNPSKE